VKRCCVTVRSLPPHACYVPAAYILRATQHGDNYPRRDCFGVSSPQFSGRKPASFSKNQLKIISICRYVKWEALKIRKLYLSGWGIIYKQIRGIIKVLFRNFLFSEWLTFPKCDNSYYYYYMVLVCRGRIKITKLYLLIIRLKNLRIWCSDFFSV